MLTPAFTTGYAITEELEGGFSNHPDDRGGATMWGITESVARAYGYTGDMRDLPKDLAKEILKHEYWDKIKLDAVDDDLLAQLMFDSSVNHGQGTAVKMAQEAYNVLSSSPIKVDGVIGPKTLKALNGHPKPFMLKMWFLFVRAEYYKKIVTRDQSQKTFIRGWTNRLNRWYKELYRTTKEAPEVSVDVNRTVDLTIQEIIRRLDN